MAFTNNRVDFFERESYTEKLHAFALVKGMENCVPQGLELTGNTLSNGYFANGGALGQLGNEGETHTITSNYTGFIVIKTTFNGVNSTSEIVESSTLLSTPLSDKGAIKYFTIYELNNGVVINDYRNRKYIKSVEVISNGDDTFTIKINDQASNEFSTSTLQNAWTKSESDGRFERAITLREVYTNSEFADFTSFAEIINFILTDQTPDISYRHPFVYTSLLNDANLPKLKLEIRQMIIDVAGLDVGTSSVNIRLEMQEGRNLTGNNILTISVSDIQTIIQMMYGSFGANYQTLDTDAFKLENIKVGNIEAENINVTNNINAGNEITTKIIKVEDPQNGLIHNTNSNNQTSTIYPFVSRYLDEAFRLALVESGDTSGYYTGLFHYNNTPSGGGVNRAFRFYSNFVDGILHTTGSGSRKLAYEAVMFDIAIEQAENQKLMLDIEIADLESTGVQTSRLSKSISARQALATNIDDQIAKYKELKEKSMQQESEL